MDMRRLLCDFVSVLALLLCCSFLVGVNASCFPGWDILEDLLPDLCPLLTSLTDPVKDLFRTHSIEEEGPITPEMVKECIKCGRELALAKKKRGNDLVKNGISLDDCTPAMSHFFSTRLPTDAKKSCDVSHDIITATKLLQMKLCSSCYATPNTFMAFLEHQVIRVNEPGYCSPVSVKYKSSRYRSADGTSNNPVRPEWGRRNAPFVRIATPKYSDGIYGMPVARSGRELPNPRMLSTRLFYDHPTSSRTMTYLSMQWAQFITHDMVFQAMEATDKGGIQCCVGDGLDVLPAELLNDKCIPISVPDDDPFYRPHGIRCLNFVRSVTTPRDDLSLGHGEQMNTVTSFIDGSQVYGSDKTLASKLRAKIGGRLRQDSRKCDQRGYLPAVDDKYAVCDVRNSSDPCYLAGDVRINQTPTLAMLHTLLLREHNRVADTLSSLNPLWSDEKLYQEARRVVLAELQHITYQEWLPTNFGENYLRYYRISPSTLYSRDYNEEVNPGIINSFGAGAFRFLHTVIPECMMMMPAQHCAGYQTAFLHKLSDHYFNPCLLESTPESFDDLLRGTVSLPAQESDCHATREITNLLFKSCNRWGMDLIAMDIQRGRDHGLASYNDFRVIGGLPRARTFEDLAGEIPQDRINALAQLYECVDDIDLFVGGAMERRLPASIAGHTFHCIIAEQFYRTRVGDMFFYDNGEMPHSFTPEQLQEIKKASIARLICDNSGVRFIQRRAFEQESAYNPKFSCEDFYNIPHVDLTAWKKPGIFDDLVL